MTPSDVKIVADNIDDFIEVPDGINRLRKAVLTLAVSGKLVPQDKKEGTADDLYAEIQAYKTTSGGALRKKKEIAAPTSYKETLVEIPESWKWVRIGDVCNLQTGATPSRNNPAYFGGDIPWLVSGDINRGEIFECEGRITKAGLENSNCKIIQQNSVLIALNGQGKTRATVAILRIPAALNQSLVAMTPFSEGLLPEYIFWYLRSQYREMRAITGQDDRRGLNMKLVGELAIPLPPSGEQKRVVKRVQQIMAQLDELEVKKRERDETHTRLTQSALQALGKGDAGVAFDQLVELMKTPADIKELENALLTLAVSGKLVPQDKKEGTANDLYLQIQRYRTEAEQNSAGRKKKGKELEPITDEEIPFTIPDTWKWVRAADIVRLITDGEHISPNKHNNGIPLVTAKNVLESGVTLEKVDYVTESDAQKFWKRCNPQKGDLVVCSRGTIGRATAVDISTPFCLMGSVILVKFFDNILSEYCKYYLRTDAGVSQIGLLRKGMAVGALYLKDIEKALIPLPPLAEQKRIVKKVEEVMVLINRLKKVMEI